MGIKSFLKKNLPYVLVEFVRKRHENLRYLQWQIKGRPVPPADLAKAKALRTYGRAFGLRTLVETGTFLGNMVEAQRKRFDRIISIELNHDLHTRAVRRFQSYPHITILEGDSGVMLGDVVRNLSGPALFWLDGHYSGGITSKGDVTTPIMNELRIVFSSPHNHVVVIDDARLFNGTDDYPALDSLKTFTAELRPEYAWDVQDDMIRLIPPAAGKTRPQP